jgi:hypothetical protein
MRDSIGLKAGRKGRNGRNGRKSLFPFFLPPVFQPILKALERINLTFV